MGRLKDALLGPEQRARTVRQCVEFVHAEVARRGRVVQLAYKALLALDPDFTAKAVGELIGPALDAVEPLYERGIARTTDRHQALAAEAGPIADALLSVTDARAKRIRAPLVARIYRRLRPRARSEIIDSLPRALPLLDDRGLE